MSSTPPRSSVRSWPWVLVLDLVLVTAFAALGRRSHEHGLDPAGILSTALPFLAACLLGWATMRAWRRPVQLWPAGVAIWLITVTAGLALRAAAGGGTAFSFQVVTLCILGAFLLGQRLAWILAGRRRAARTAKPSAPVH